MRSVFETSLFYILIVLRAFWEVRFTEFVESMKLAFAGVYINVVQREIDNSVTVMIFY